jgi:membrane protease YdiL (CAAX protease family)
MKIYPYIKISIASLAVLVVLFLLAGTYTIAGMMDQVIENTWLLHIHNVVMGAIWVCIVLILLRYWENKKLSDLGCTLTNVDKWFLIFSFLISLLFIVGFIVFQEFTDNQITLSWNLVQDHQYFFLLAASSLGWTSAAFKEELLSRGFVMYQLRHMNVHAMVAVSAVFFMLLHVPTNGFDLYKVVSWLLGGVLYAYAYVKSGSILVSTGLHAIHNFLNELILGRALDFSIVALQHPITEAEKLLYEMALKFALLLLVLLIYRGRKDNIAPHS